MKKKTKSLRPPATEAIRSKPTRFRTPKPSSELIIVGIGASAGGLEAIQVLLSKLPPDTGMGFVFVQHLSPTHESMLVAILGRMTRMPVSEVTDGTRVEKNQLYVIPPNTNMRIQNGVLKLESRNQSEKPPLPIDRFFRSLADDQRERAIAIVLSGTGSDGAEGARAVKAEGGMSIAQDPASARYGSMPEKAIVIDDIDLVLKPEEIGPELARLSRTQLPPIARFSLGREKSDLSGDEISQILSLLRLNGSTDLTQYKSATLERRIHRRIRLNKLNTLKEYLKLLQASPQELKSLSEDVLINVTSFFREPESFEYLAAKILDPFLKKKKQDGTIRVWSAACSTGEEAYSLAICIQEALLRNQMHIPFQLFATDLSEKCIDRARQGRYTDAISDQVPRDLLEKYFQRTETGYQISKSIRDLCVFAKHDLLKDPPFSKLDLISSKNVLIYLDQPAQHEIMETFHYSLNPDGMLILGSSESIGDAANLFQQMTDSKLKIYTKKSNSSKLRALLKPSRTLEPESTSQKPSPPKAHGQSEIQIESDRAVLARYSPPGVVVDSRMNILQFRGNTEPYFLHKSGDASLNLLKLARAGLATELQALITQAKLSDLSTRKESVNLAQGLVHIECLPLKFLPGERCFLIAFEPEAHPVSKFKSDTPKKGKLPRLSKDSSSTSLQKNSQTIKHLKQELANSKEHLQAVIEDLERANQDLQSANEETVTSNEELQSTNEELETSKEELQSTNEELSTVNEELYSRNRDLFGLNNDLVNLLSSVHIPILIVGNDLAIKRFTPTASKIFNVIPADIGRPLSDITSNLLETADLVTEIRTVIDEGAVRELEIQDREGAWHLLKVRPYKTQDNRIDGAVVSLTDIDLIKQATQISSAVLDSVRYPLLILNQEFHILRANDAFYRLFQTSKQKVENRPLFEIGSGEWNSEPLKKLLTDVIQAADRPNEPVEIKTNLPALKDHQLFVRALQVPREPGQLSLILITIDPPSEPTIAITGAL